MAKTSVFGGGGGGSCGKAVSIPAWLIEKSKAMRPPDGGFSLKEYMAQTGFNRKYAITVLRREVEAGRLDGRKFTMPDGGNTWFYWETKKAKTRK